MIFKRIKLINEKLWQHTTSPLKVGFKTYKNKTNFLKVELIRVRVKT